MKTRVGVTGALALLLAAGVATQLVGPDESRCEQRREHTVVLSVVLDEAYPVDVKYTIDDYRDEYAMRGGQKRWHEIVDDVTCGSVVTLDAVKRAPGTVRCSITVGAGNRVSDEVTGARVCTVRTVVS